METPLPGPRSTIAAPVVFVPTSAPLNVPRAGHAAVRLRNGKVLIVGGSGDRTAEIYDPRNDNFMLSNSMMMAARAAPTATLLNDGRVLIAGGLDNNGAGFQAPRFTIHGPTLLWQWRL